MGIGRFRGELSHEQASFFIIGMRLKELVQERLCISELACPSQNADLGKVRRWRVRAPSGQRGDPTHAEHRRCDDQVPLATTYGHLVSIVGTSLLLKPRTSRFPAMARKAPVREHNGARYDLPPKKT